MAHTDSVVIGSSPLMLLIALAERERGQSVTVVDASGAYGGAWRTVHTAAGMNVEYACHLIEQFPGVYECLAKASGAEFAPLDVQPVRILSGGRRVRYSSRTTLVLGAAWSAFRIVRHGLQAALGIGATIDRERDVVFRQKLGDFARDHWRLLWRGSIVQAPINGHAAFIRGLIDRCIDTGVRFEQLQVVSASDDGNRWTVMGSEGRSIQADHVHCTTSALLSQTAPGCFEAKPLPDVVTRSILVEVRDEHIVEPVSYAAFWDDPEVVRISRIDGPGRTSGARTFLIQLSSSAAGHERAPIVTRVLVSSGILRVGSHAKILEEIACPRVPHTQQMPSGRIDRSFQTYSSAGNLASGVARWLREGNL